jgi:hypothetical protein
VVQFLPKLLPSCCGVALILKFREGRTGVEWNLVTSRKMAPALVVEAQHTSGIYHIQGFGGVVGENSRFIPGPTIGDGAQLVAAIHGINSLQQMAMMTSDPHGARRKLSKALRALPILRKPSRLEDVLRLLRQPVLPLSVGFGGLGSHHPR